MPVRGEACFAGAIARAFDASNMTLIAPIHVDQTRSSWKFAITTCYVTTYAFETLFLRASGTLCRLLFGGRRFMAWNLELEWSGLNKYNGNE